jgi:NAD(P)-dependent dehydrogenase (short-subunit alcohol dehydrogenase family)
MNTTTPHHSPLGVPGTALITGAASGIGLAITHLLVRSGCSSIALCDLNPTALSAAAFSLPPLATYPSFRAVTITVDVSDEASVKAMAQEAVGALGGRIDYAVN